MKKPSADAKTKVKDRVERGPEAPVLMPPEGNDPPERAKRTPNLIKPAQMPPEERMARLLKLVDHYAVDGMWRWIYALPGFDDEYVPLLAAMRDQEHDVHGCDAFERLRELLKGNEEAKAWLFELDAHYGADYSAHEEACFALGFQVAQRLRGAR